MPENLYTRVPYADTYEAGVTEAIMRCCGGFGPPRLVVNATLVIANGQQSYMADGRATVAVRAPNNLAPGDFVSLAYGDVSDRDVEPGGIRVGNGGSNWFITTHDNPIHVRDLGTTVLDYTDGYARITHAFGEITGISNFDCGTDHTCWLFSHKGVQNKVRVRNNNPYGLDPDYAGGLCAEMVAPVGRWNGTNGTAHFLDAYGDGWMRVWPKP